MITKEITVFDTRSIDEGDVVFVKIDNEYRKALIETAKENYLRFVYINDAGTTNSKMILIDEYLKDKTLIRPAHCYIK
jgi:hypothetical protein